MAFRMLRTLIVPLLVASCFLATLAFCFSKVLSRDDHGYNDAIQPFGRRSQSDDPYSRSSLHGDGSRGTSSRGPAPGHRMTVLNQDGQTRQSAWYPTKSAVALQKPSYSHAVTTGGVRDWKMGQTHDDMFPELARSSSPSKAPASGSTASKPSEQQKSRKKQGSSSESSGFSFFSGSLGTTYKPPKEQKSRKQQGTTSGPSEVSFFGEKGPTYSKETTDRFPKYHLWDP